MKHQTINDYVVLCENILFNIDKHYTLKRNYTIQKDENLQKVLDILEDSAALGDKDALLSLGFLYYNGVIL